MFWCQQNHGETAHTLTAVCIISSCSGGKDLIMRCMGQIFVRSTIFAFPCAKCWRIPFCIRSRSSRGAVAHSTNAGCRWPSSCWPHHWRKIIVQVIVAYGWCLIQSPQPLGAYRLARFAAMDWRFIFIHFKGRCKADDPRPGLTWRRLRSDLPWCSPAWCRLPSRSFNKLIYITVLKARNVMHLFLLVSMFFCQQSAKFFVSSMSCLFWSTCKHGALYDTSSRSRSRLLYEIL